VAKDETLLIQTFQIRKELHMKKIFVAGLAGMSLGAVLVTFAEPVHDWRDLDAVHTHVVEALQEMERAAAANHYDMSGHARSAEAALRKTEAELKLAIESAKSGK
jgi:hypothetical protein